MAVRRKIGNLANILLQSHLQKREREHQSELVKQRQMEIALANDDLRRKQAEDQRQHTLLLRGVEDPALMETFARNGVDVGIDPTMFRTGDDKILSQLGSKISQAKREELPTDLGVEQQLGATPWGSGLARDPRAVKHGMTVRDDRKRQLDDIDAYQTDLKGAEAFATRYNTDMGAETAAAENHPAQLKREKDTFSAMTPLHASRAGAERGAQLAAEWNPAIVAKKLDLKQKEHEMELLQQGRLDEAKAARDQGRAIAGLIPNIERLKNLSKTVNIYTENDPRRILATGISTESLIGKPMGLNFQLPGAAQLGIRPDMKEMHDLQESTAIAMANGIGGNKGPVTEADKEAMKARLPGPNDSYINSIDKINNLDDWLQVAMEVAGKAHPDATPSERIALAHRLYDERVATLSTTLPPLSQADHLVPPMPRARIGRPATIGPSRSAEPAIDRLNRLRQGRQ
jgi:hypothetical protein